LLLFLNREINQVIWKIFSKSYLSTILTLTFSLLTTTVSATTITYEYDTLDRPVIVTDGVTDDKKYTYDDAGNRTDVTVGTGTSVDPFSSVVMQCFVDTSRDDQYTSNSCTSAANPSTTTAVFKVANLQLSASEYSLSWQTTGCSSSSATSTCSKSIRHYQSIKVTAVLTHIQTGNTKSLSATAHYEGLF
jgi:YD repeat-containing protein